MCPEEPLSFAPDLELSPSRNAAPLSAPLFEHTPAVAPRAPAGAVVDRAGAVVGAVVGGGGGGPLPRLLEEETQAFHQRVSTTLSICGISVIFEKRVLRRVVRDESRSIESSNDVVPTTLFILQIGRRKGDAIPRYYESLYENANQKLFGRSRRPTPPPPAARRSSSSSRCRRQRAARLYFGN